MKSVKIEIRNSPDMDITLQFVDNGNGEGVEFRANEEAIPYILVRESEGVAIEPKELFVPVKGGERRSDTY